MRRGNLYILAAIAVISVLLAWYVGRTPQETIQQSGQPVLPDFLKTFSKARRIVLRSHEGIVTLVAREEGHSWQVQERFGYAADLGKLRALRDGWAALEVIEPKTSRPEHFNDLDLTDLADPQSKALQVQLMDEQGATLMDWLVGKHRFIPGGGEQQDYYVRRTQEHATWLVRGALPLETKPEQWLDPQVVDIAADRVLAVHLMNAGLTVKPRDAVSVEVAGLAAGEEVISQYTFSNLVETLRTIQLNDVLPAKEIPSDPIPLARFQLDTKDGLRIDYRLVSHGEKKYMVLRAEVIEQQVPPATPPATAPDKAGSGQQHEVQGLSVGEQAKALNTRWEPWAFELRSYDATKLLRERKDMVRKAQQQPRR